MIPSWALTMVMHTESPIPIFRLESLSFPSSDWKLPSNILGRTDSSIPAPSSSTENFTWSPSSVTINQIFVMPSAWSTQFSRRFTITCSIRIASTDTTTISSGTVTETACPNCRKKILDALAGKNILGGAEVDGGILWCVTELVSKEKLDEVVAIVKEVLGK